MSRLVLVLCSLFLLKAQDSALVPAEVLPRIEARAAAARHYLFEGDLTLVVQRGTAAGRLLSKAHVRLALGPEGRSYLRLAPADKDEYLLVSNGRKSWAYVPRLKQYTEQEAAILAGDAGDEDDAGAGDEERDYAEVFSHEVMRVLSTLARTARASDVHGTAPVRFEGKKAEWPVLRVVSKKDDAEGTTLTELAVDPATLDIGRMVWSNLSYVENTKVLLRMTVDFTTFRLGDTLPDDTFTFDPPKKTRLVETLPIPGQTGSFLLNKPAPDFELKTLDGEKIRLADLRGRTVLLSFWASWCGPCRRELPRLVKLHDELKDNGVVVLGVNDEGRSEARRYAEEAKLTFRTLDDSGLKAHRLYRVRSIPTVFIIDRDGKVARFLKGAHEEADLRAALKAAGL